MKVKTNYPGCSYVIPGKEYEVEESNTENDLLKGLFWVILEDETHALIIAEPETFCAHLGGRGKWEIVGKEYTKKTKTLYVLIGNAGDGSYYNQYTFDKDLLDRIQVLYDQGKVDYESCPGVDADGFHYSKLELPLEVTAESLGISVLDDDYDKHLYDDGEDF